MKIVARVAYVFLGVSTCFAQSPVTTKIASVGPEEAIAGAPITITAELRQAETIEHAYVVYRPFGQSEYERMEMDIVGNTAAATLPSKFVLPPFLEFYIVLADRAGSLETYPLSENADPFTTPPGQTIHLPVRTQEEGESGVVFLSPDAMSVVAPEDVLISISLLRVDSTVVKSATQLFLDGADITRDALFSDDIVVYAPENLAQKLAPGVHRIGVRLYNRQGSLYRVASLLFTVQGTGSFAYTEAVTGEFKYGVSFQLESRREQVGGDGMWYNRGGYQFTGSAGEWRFASNVFATSDEKQDRQPQNRYYAGAQAPWISLGLGDSYPEFPSLILSGKRIRGVNGSIRLGVVNVDIAYGSVNRAVEGAVLSSFSKDSLAAEQQRDPAASYAPIDSSHWGKFSYGTYARKMFVVRPSFGSGETFQLGFTWLKSKDDLSSIQYGIRPQENLVVGSDVVARFDDRRIEFSGQGAFSAYNSDISSGNFTDAYIDSVYAKDPATVKKVRDILSPFITVNDNIRPLSLKNLSTVAYDLGLGLHYFENAFRFTYLYRGGDYNSFGQTFLRNDIQGYNIQDRVRLIENTVFLTLGYERLKDNTDSAKVATTTYSNVTAAVSYAPIGDLPGLTAGVAHFLNFNGLPVAGPDSLDAVDDRTVRFFLQSTYGFRFLVPNTATLNVSTSNRTDNSIRHYNVKNTVLGIGLTSQIAVPFQAGVDLAANLNTLPSADQPGVASSLNYTTLSLRGRYEIEREILSITADVTPTFGDFRRTVLDLGSEWFLYPAMRLQFQFSYFRNSGTESDSFVSLKYQYDL